MMRQAGQNGVVGRGVDAAEIDRDAGGAVAEGGVAEIADQAGDAVLGQITGVHWRVIARDTDRTGLPKGSSLVRAPRRAVRSRSSWARAEVSEAAGTSGMGGVWRDLCDAARGLSLEETI